MEGYYSPCSVEIQSIQYTTDIDCAGAFATKELTFPFYGYEQIRRITIQPTTTNGYGITNQYLELKLAYADPNSDLNNENNYTILDIWPDGLYDHVDYFTTSSSSDFTYGHSISKSTNYLTSIPHSKSLYLFLNCPNSLNAHETIGILNPFKVTVEYDVDLDRIAYISYLTTLATIDSIDIICYESDCINCVVNNQLPIYYYYSTINQDFIDNMAIVDGTDPGQWHKLINESITIENLSPNTTYYIHVAAAIDGSKVYNGYRDILINNNLYTLSQKQIITTDNYTNCSPPTSISGTSFDGTVSIQWSGATGGNYNPITGYNIIYKIGTNGTSSNPIQVNASTNLYTFDNLTIGSSYYFAIQTLGTYGNSNYKWIETPITVTQAHPTVAKGAIITKMQMDSLHSYKNNNNLTKVTKGNVITAVIGNEYKANSVSTGTLITADWYNNA